MFLASRARYEIGDPDGETEIIIATSSSDAIKIWRQRHEFDKEDYIKIRRIYAKRPPTKWKGFNE